MVKVLIYSSKEIYEKASYTGRAEAHLIAYREDEYYYRIMKNRTSQFVSSEKVVYSILKRIIELAERDEWKHDLKNFNLKESYRNHPFTTLMKNEPADV